MNQKVATHSRSGGVVDLLTQENIAELMETRDEWLVSMFMPTHRAGKEVQQNSIRFKNLLRVADDRLSWAGLEAEAKEKLLEQGQNLLRHFDFWSHQNDGLAVFLSHDMIEYYRLPYAFDELVVVGKRFHIKPLIRLLSADTHFYLLALSQNSCRLFHGNRFQLSEVVLKDIPSSLAEALKYDQFEKQLQYHTGAPTQRGRRPAMFHGQGVGTDDSKEYILQYFRQLDRGVSRFLNKERAPLMLAGVEYLHPLYEQANTYPHLIDEGIRGNPELATPDELHDLAWQIVRPLLKRERDDRAKRYWDVIGTGLATNRVTITVPAAYAGRVDTLFVPVGKQRWGRFDTQRGEVITHSEPEPGDEDLLDLAAVETMSRKGTVYAVEHDQMPDNTDVAATLRY
jgi:hypothetical protein